MRSIAALRMVTLALGTTMLCGCLTSGLPSGSTYVPPDENGVITDDLDPKDYQAAASELCQRLLRKKDRLESGYVLTLGPVDTRGTTASVDIEILQDKLEVALSDGGDIRFTALKKAMTGGESAFDTMNKLAEMNWALLTEEDRDWLGLFNKRHKVDGILYGRVSSQRRQRKDGAAEITYTYVWRVADVATGLIKNTVEYQMRKVIR
jgi:hypothetical protein